MVFQASFSLDDAAFASALNDRFVFVFSVERLDSIPAVSQLDYPLMDYLSLNFPGIESIINSLKLSPSPGTREINWQNPEKHCETVKCISVVDF